MIDWTALQGPETIAAEALARAKAQARAQLATTIAAARSAVITDLPGQGMIYQAKEAEARAWVAATTAAATIPATGPTPVLADYPLLAAETGLTAPTPDQLAQLWLNMATLWRQIAAGLEAIRLGIGAQIDAAGTVEEVEAAVESLEQAEHTSSMNDYHPAPS